MWLFGSDPQAGDPGATEAAYRACVRTATVSALFSLVVLALLLANYVSGLAYDPVEPPELTTLKARLVKQPQDESLKAAIRSMDQEVRERYFGGKAFAYGGNLLLAGGMLFFIASVKAAKRLRRKLPKPGPDPEDPWSSARRARLAAAVLGGVACVGLVVMAVGSRRDIALEYGKAVGVTGQRKAGRAASAKEMAAHWPQFRGPNSAGAAPSAKPPERWDGAKGENIRWKAPVPLPGENSPVVWRDRVFLSGADAEKREVYCFAAGDGKLLWRQPVGSAGGESEPPNILEDTGYAAPTMATDGRRVFAMFASGHVGCFDFEGQLQWVRNLGVPDNMYGHATSLVVHGERLLVQYDQGTSPDDGKSALLALDTATGKTLWETKRPVPNSWSTPIVVKAEGRDEVITCGNPWVIAYDPATGTERWRAECLGGDVAPTPVFAGGLVFTVNVGSQLSAIRPGGQGDVTGSAIAWQAYDGLPDMTSPAANEELLFLVTSDGMLTCYDAKDGTRVWEQYLEKQFRSSPTLIGNRLYVMDTEGVMHILEAGRAYKELATAPLGEPANTSPAYIRGRVYIRGKENLYCIGR